MATIAQLTANRANAQLSTGPTTPAGIEASKFNATRHGLSGQQVVIKGENPAEFEALRRELMKEYAPQTNIECLFVEQVAQNWWRLQRARRAEAQLIDKYGLFNCLTDPETIKIFQRVSRYLTGIERSWRHAVTMLDKIRAQRAKETKAAAKIGSVSQPAAQPVAVVAMPQPQAAVLGASSSRADSAS